MSISTWNMVHSVLLQMGVHCSTVAHMLIPALPVVKNPLSPIEHPGGVGVNNELFEESLEQFVVGPS